MPHPPIHRSLKTIPLDLIDRDPDQPRKNFDPDKLNNLARSIEADGGVSQIVVVKRHPNKPGRYMIVTGERRWRALKILGYKEYEFIVREGGPPSSYKTSVAENTNREDLDPIEEARSMKRLRDEGCSIAEIEKLTGRSDFTIYRRFELLDLPPEVQEMVASGDLPALKVLHLRKHPQEEQIKRAHELLSGVSLEMAEEQLAKSKKPRKARPTDADADIKITLRRAMKFAWDSRSQCSHVEMLLALRDENFKSLMGEIAFSSQKTLQNRFTELAATAQKMAKRLAKLNPIDVSKPVQTAAQEPVVVKSPDKPVPEIPSRHPIIPLTALPVPHWRSIAAFGKGQSERYRDVLRYLFCNPERHGQVMLGKDRLRGILGLPRPNDAEELALDAIQVAWASWHMQPLNFVNSFQREFMSQIVQMKIKLDNDFPKAINAAWMVDKSSDPISLGKLVTTSIQ